MNRYCVVWVFLHQSCRCCRQHITLSLCPISAAPIILVPVVTMYILNRICAHIQPLIIVREVGMLSCVFAEVMRMNTQTAAPSLAASLPVQPTLTDSRLTHGLSLMHMEEVVERRSSNDGFLCVCVCKCVCCHAQSLIEHYYNIGFLLAPLFYSLVNPSVFLRNSWNHRGHSLPGSTSKRASRNVSHSDTALW